MITRSNGMQVIHQNSNANPFSGLGKSSSADGAAKPNSKIETLGSDSDVSFEDVLKCCGDGVVCCYDGTKKDPASTSDQNASIENSDTDSLNDSIIASQEDAIGDTRLSNSKIDDSLHGVKPDLNGTANRGSDNALETLEREGSSAVRQSPFTTLSPFEQSSPLIKETSAVGNGVTEATNDSLSAKTVVAEGQSVVDTLQSNSTAGSPNTGQANRVGNASSVAETRQGIAGNPDVTTNSGDVSQQIIANAQRTHSASSARSQTNEVSHVREQATNIAQVPNNTGTDLVTHSDSDVRPATDSNELKNTHPNQALASGVHPSSSTNEFQSTRESTPPSVQVEQTDVESRSLSSQPSGTTAPTDEQQIYSLPDPDLPFPRQEQGTKVSIGVDQPDTSKIVQPAVDVADSRVQIATSEIGTSPNAKTNNTAFPVIPGTSTGDINSPDAEIRDAPQTIRLATVASLNSDAQEQVEDLATNELDSTSTESLTENEDSESSTSNDDRASHDNAPRSSSLIDAYNSASKYGSVELPGTLTHLDAASETYAIEPSVANSHSNATPTEFYGAVHNGTPELVPETLQRIGSDGKVASTNGANSIASSGNAVSPSQVSSQVTSAIVQLSEQPGGESIRRVAIELEPAELGSLLIQVEQTSESIVTQVIASELTSKELLHQHRDQLIEALSELGFENASVDISHQQKNDDPNGSRFGQRDANGGNEDGNQSTASSARPKSNHNPSRLDIVA